MPNPPRVDRHRATGHEPDPTRRRLEGMTMDALLAAHPRAADVLSDHGVDPRTRCHVAARRHMTLRQVLGRTCAVDDVEATWRDLLHHVREADT